MAGIGSGNALYPDGGISLPGGPGGLPAPESPLSGMSLPPNDMMNLSGNPPRRKKRPFLKWFIGLAAGAGAVALAVWGSRRYATNKFIGKVVGVTDKTNADKFRQALFSHLKKNEDGTFHLNKITQENAPDALKKSWWGRWGANRFLKALALDPSPKGLEAFLEKLKVRITDLKEYESLKQSMLECHSTLTGKRNE
jgi:hypothetical protein